MVIVFSSQRIELSKQNSWTGVVFQCEKRTSASNSMTHFRLITTLQFFLLLFLWNIFINNIRRRWVKLVKRLDAPDQNQVFLLLFFRLFKRSGLARILIYAATVTPLRRSVRRYDKWWTKDFNQAHNVIASRFARIWSYWTFFVLVNQPDCTLLRVHVCIFKTVHQRKLKLCIG